VTITPTVVIVTDTNGKPIRTETIYPKPPPGTPAPTPADESGPKTVTVTVTPGNPGILTLGQNDAGQWIGMLIGAVFGALTTVAVITRRRGDGSSAPDVAPPSPDEPPVQPTPDEPAPVVDPAAPVSDPPSVAAAASIAAVEEPLAQPDPKD